MAVEKWQDMELTQFLLNPDANHVTSWEIMNPKPDLENWLKLSLLPGPVRPQSVQELTHFDTALWNYYGWGYISDGTIFQLSRNYRSLVRRKVKNWYLERRKTGRA